MTQLKVGISKRQFLTQNEQAISEMLADVDIRLTGTYGATHTSVTPLDIWVLTYCEAGITTSGHVDPSFIHSEGEIGLYPLPSNIRSWNGPTAPRHDAQTSVEVNCFNYYLYLGHLKNKTVKTQDNIKLYRDIFIGQIEANRSVMNAKLLAGVVHGYFFAGNYGDGLVPISALLAGFEADLPLDKILKKTSYKHAGSTILSNRNRNIEGALRDFTLK